MKAAFVHKRLREKPPSGGASTLRESVKKPELVARAMKLLRSLEYNGIAMVEFKLDVRDNEYKLLEINPRYWGSLALAITSGVDFPYLQYLLATDQDFEPILNYQEGIRCRWLIGDISHFLLNPKRFQLKPSFFELYKENLYYDIISFEDPAPIIGHVLSGINILLTPSKRKILSGYDLSGMK